MNLQHDQILLLVNSIQLLCFLHYNLLKKVERDKRTQKISTNIFLNPGLLGYYMAKSHKKLSLMELVVIGVV